METYNENTNPKFWIKYSIAHFKNLQDELLTESDKNIGLSKDELKSIKGYGDKESNKNNNKESNGGKKRSKTKKAKKSRKTKKRRRNKSRKSRR